MGRPSNRDERRRQIVLGLMQAMGEQGYEGATITQIASNAKLAPGLIHYHFDSKLQILLALVEHIGNLVEQRFDARKPGDDPLKQLDALIDAHLALGEDADRAAVGAWVAIGTEAMRQTQVREVYEKVVERELERFEAIVTAVLREREQSTRNAANIAAGILSSIEGAYRLASAAPAAMPGGFAAPAVRAMARGALAQR
jgi:TetR/AcrR family transcriptional repressor of bet genes